MKQLLSRIFKVNMEYIQTAFFHWGRLILIQSQVACWAQKHLSEMGNVPRFFREKKPRQMDLRKGVKLIFIPKFVGFLNTLNNKSL